MLVLAGLKQQHSFKTSGDKNLLQLCLKEYNVCRIGFSILGHYRNR